MHHLIKQVKTMKETITRLRITLEKRLLFFQIAGLIARRIVCETSKDQHLRQGERIGMIRFGSRADVYFENYETLVKVGQKTIAGETLLAKR